MARGKQIGDALSQQQACGGYFKLVVVGEDMLTALGWRGRVSGDGE